MYPEEHGPDLPLLWLTAFPEGTHFKNIDEIDQCSLFMAMPPHPHPSDPFSERNFHVAIWNEDLIELHERGHVTGIDRTITARGWRRRQLDKLSKGPLFYETADGTLHEIDRRRYEEGYDDEDPYSVEVSREGIAVSTSGRAYIASVLRKTAEDFSLLSSRVPPLLKLGYFDIAVREACVSLEWQIKSTIGSSLWGNQLADAFIAQVRASGLFIDSFVKILRAKVRTAFKFIRNDYAHNLRDMDEITCKALLLRLSSVKRDLDEVCGELGK
jgi:hypothetical protein